MLLTAGTALAQGAGLGDAALTNAPQAESASTYSLDNRHILSPGDRITFRILEDRLFGEGESTTNLVVTDSRELDLPLIGRYSVTNKTCLQLVREVTPLYERDYYKRATVVLGIDVVNRVRGKVYISGMVKNQGAMDLLFDEPLTAGQAILKSGGFGEFANKKAVKVIRNRGEKKTFTINMVDVFEKGKSELDILLEPDDQIMVPERSTTF